jgi:hypothetical protein
LELIIPEAKVVSGEHTAKQNHLQNKEIENQEAR